MKIQIFTGTFNSTSKTYVLDTDGTTPLALAISNFIGNITPKFINQTQSNPSTTTYPNLTISIFY